MILKPAQLPNAGLVDAIRQLLEGRGDTAIREAVFEEVRKPHERLKGVAPAQRQEAAPCAAISMNLPPVEG